MLVFVVSYDMFENIPDPNGMSPEELLEILEEALESGDLSQGDIIQMLADYNRKE